MKSAIRVVGGVFYRRDPQIQIQMFRKNYGSLAGFYEFPGGKVESGETQEAALVRELREELGVDINVQSYVGHNTFEVADRIFELHIYLMSLSTSSQEFQLKDHDQWLWLDEVSVTGHMETISPGDRPLLASIFEKIKTKI